MQWLSMTIFGMEQGTDGAGTVPIFCATENGDSPLRRSSRWVTHARKDQRANHQICFVFFARFSGQPLSGLLSQARQLSRAPQAVPCVDCESGPDQREADH